MTSLSPMFFKYHQSLHPTRINLMQSQGHNFFSSQHDSKKLHGFLILWTSHSIVMTKNVEYWIKAAGESCNKIGQNTIGTSLITHAKHEAGHDSMLVNDLSQLVKLWNQNYGGSMSTQEILSLKTPESSNSYVKLHEEIIKGSAPYSQVAVEYEIERLSISIAPQWVENIIYRLGDSFRAGLTFLEEHILIDQGHTKFNTNLIEKCLEETQDLNSLIRAGTEALICYQDFLNDCKKEAERLFSGT